MTELLSASSLDMPRILSLFLSNYFLIFIFNLSLYPLYFYLLRISLYICFLNYSLRIFIPLRGQSSRTHERSFVLRVPDAFRTCIPISGAYIKESFMTRYARAGAAKKAAGCGEEARGASLSYLEPFPVNLGPPLSVYIVVVCYAHSSPAPSRRTSATRMHSRTRVHARATL